MAIHRSYPMTQAEIQPVLGNATFQVSQNNVRIVDQLREQNPLSREVVWSLGSQNSSWQWQWQESTGVTVESTPTDNITTTTLGATVLDNTVDYIPITYLPTFVPATTVIPTVEYRYVTGVDPAAVNGLVERFRSQIHSWQFMIRSFAQPSIPEPLYTVLQQMTDYADVLATHLNLGVTTINPGYVPPIKAEIPKVPSLVIEEDSRRLLV